MGATCTKEQGSERVIHGCRYGEQRRAHEEVLGRFEGDMEALAGVEIAPAVAAAAGQLRSLLDLVPEQRVRDWAAQCAASHQHLSDKVPRWNAPCCSKCPPAEGCRARCY
jgi:hypothetical protein